MDAARRVTTWTEDEYLERERRSQTKNEFLRGEIFAMAGAKFRHNTIAANSVATLVFLLRGKGCRVFNSDQRLCVPETGLYTYADAGVVCDKPEFHKKDRMTLLNPLVLVEVLSRSTESYDRGEKLAHYRRIPTLRGVLLIAQTKSLVEHHQRLSTGDWLLSEHQSGTIELPALGGAVSLGEIYDLVDFTQDDAD